MYHLLQPKISDVAETYPKWILIWLLALCFLCVISARSEKHAQMRKVNN